MPPSPPKPLTPESSLMALPKVEGQPLSAQDFGPPPVHHSRYYFQDEMATFLVEDKLFKVHRHFLTQESQVFQWMFMCPPRQDGPDGTTDDRPIPLPEVKSHEFERLLDFFYEGMYRRPYSLLFPNGSAPFETEEYFEQWIDLLSISTRYDFERVRERAIDAIGQSPVALDPIRQICLAEKYDIPQWLAPAFASLCQRSSPLEVHEAEKIGIRYTTLVARAREAVREAAVPKPNPPPPSAFGLSSPPVPPTNPPGLPYSTSLVTRIVNEVFFPPPIKLKKRR